MRFITCASYYGTGSSAVTDYVSEFRGVDSLTNDEFRFIQDPDGIDDLRYHLVDNHNRHNAGHALKRYKKLVDFYSGNALGRKYSIWFGEQWKSISYEYIDSLVDFSYKGWWMYDLYDKGKIYYFRKRIINYLLHKTVWKGNPDRVFNTMKHEITYCSHPTEKEFITKTKLYIEKLFSTVASSTDSTIMVDQIVPPSNIKRYSCYFEDIKVVVVDRDPRDLYCCEKYLWKDGIIPYDDVKVFCEWYKYTRNHRLHEVYENNVLLIQFEDLIYRYESTTAQLREFLGLKESDHYRMGFVFKPEVSINNTQLWEKYPGSEKDIKYIENELNGYWYDYSTLLKESESADNTGNRNDLDAS